MIDIVIDYVIRSTNTLLCRRCSSRLRDLKVSAMSSLLAKVGRINPDPERRRYRVEITSMRKRLIDDDNGLGVKPLVDAMRASCVVGIGRNPQGGIGLIYDDAPQWLDLVVDQELTRDKPCTRIRIR